jgi:uncharacterized protein
MRVRLRSISPLDGLDLSFQILPQVMGKAVAEKDEIPQVFDTPIDCNLHLEITGKEVFMTGDSRTTIHPVCARCNETFPHELRVDALLTLRPQEKGPPGADSYQESEEGLVYFRKEELDLDEIVREQLLLALPMRHLCRTDCQGLCPQCGANLNLGPHTCTVRAAKKP